MQEYLKIVHNVLDGQEKQPTRNNGEEVKNSTICSFGEVFRHDMDNGFPLLTIRKMPWKSICIELEGFIKGITDKNWFEERGCKYWSYWYSPITKDKTDLGPLGYSWNWRNFDQEYTSKDGLSVVEGVNNGRDQFADIVNTLNTNPYDRRMVCSAWNPNQNYAMALPPCHFAWNVVVIGDRLNLGWVQRSCDVLLGLPSNIASYALLMLLLCKESGLKPGILQGTLNDCHIYKNQLGNNLKELITRTPKSLPKIVIPDEKWMGIYEWNHTEVELVEYESYPKLNFELTI